MNLWPPFWGLRVHILHIAPDWHEVTVRMKLSLRNKNYVGTHFGGGLFAMCDPFYMLLLTNILGRDYVVWDKAGAIDFIAPGRRTVFAKFAFTQTQIEEIKKVLETERKFEPTYEVEIRDDQNALVARVKKQVYIRLAKKAVAQ